MARKTMGEQGAGRNGSSFENYAVSLGDMLRGRRASKGKSLIDVERDLGIRRYVIAAIEQGQADVFENPAFVPSYVRAYARYLGLDGDRTFELFCSESGFSVRTAAGSTTGLFSAGPVTRRVEAPVEEDIKLEVDLFRSSSKSRWAGISFTSVVSTIVLVGLIGGLGYFGNTALREFQQIEKVSVDLEYEIVAEAESVVQPEYFQEVVASREWVVPEFDGFDFSRDIASVQPIGYIEPGSTGVLAEVEQVLVEAPPPPAVVENLEPPVEEVVAEVPVVPVPRDVRIFPARDAWVRVRASDQTILIEKILRAGEVYPVPSSEGPLTLRAGNSGSVYFLIGETLYGPAGRKTGVVKNLSLEAESLMEAYEPVDVATLPRDVKEFLAAAEISDTEGQ